MDDEPERNPLLARAARQHKQSKGYWRSRPAERELAKRVGGRVTPGSGNQQRKGDVQTKHVTRLEHKVTGHNSFSITKEMLDKIEHAALASTEIPAIIVEFLDPKREIAVIPAWALEELLNRLREAEESAACR